MKVFIERVVDKGYVTLFFGVMFDDGHREYTTSGGIMGFFCFYSEMCCHINRQHYKLVN